MALPSPSDQRPISVSWLGYGGLLPFLAGAVACWFDVHHRDLWLDALLAYGAVILSFVGALHWAFAMTAPATLRLRGVYAWSVMPALIGWGALLLPGRIGVWLLIFGFVSHLWQDMRLAAVLGLPRWYMPMRVQLTVVACLCLASTWWLRSANWAYGTFSA